MKFIKYLPYLIFLVMAVFYFKVYHQEDLGEYHIINLSRKQIISLDEGNPLYQIRGIKTNFNSHEVLVKKFSHGLILESKTNIWGNYRKILLLEGLDKNDLNLHDRSTINTDKILVRFNAYDHKEYLIVPFIDQENMELSNERFSYFSTMLSDDEMILDASRENLTFKKGNKFYSFNKYVYLKDPLSEGYTILPDFLNGKLKPLKKDNTIKEFKKTKAKQQYVFQEDISFDSILEFANLNISNHPGITITLEKNADLVFESCNANFGNLRIVANGDNSIIFRNCKEISMDSLQISGISNYISQSYSLPSGLTFINSKVIIRNSSFSNNKRGDDFVNFYLSDFEMHDTHLIDILSDAIDSDFSNGIISNSTFTRVGNDGVDFSGSEIKLTKNLFENIGDKCISSGEYSKVESNENNMIYSAVGLVVKDGSILKTTGDKFTGNTVDVAVFMKKDFYNDPLLIFNDVLNEINYLIEKKNYVTTYHKEPIKITKNVEDLMYGNIYGKASNR